MFENVQKKLGFGFMRLPMIEKKVDIEETKCMVDLFIEKGFNYFDTAHGYLDGESEKAIKECITSRYPRDKYVLANKLTDPYFTKAEDIRPFFEEQLKICGVDYFDFYLMHALRKENYDKFKKCRAFETAFELKKEGKIKHVGFSFHDRAEFLEKILSENPEVEFVQIQLNYVDFEDAAIQSRKCYEVLRRYNKPVIIMEPVRGGSLVNLPQEASDIFKSLGGGSNASYAIRYASSFDGVFMVLSGMSNLEQVKDNVSYMADFKKITDKEREAIDKVCKIFNSKHLIQCTSCRYCTPGCPKNISIPDLFSCMNAKKLYNNWNSSFYYSIHTRQNGKASDCIECGKCEKVCPQHLSIRELLKDVADTFENKGEIEC